MKFLATEFRADGEYGKYIYADDWDAAQAVCEQHGWRLDGEIGAIIPASDTFGQKQADEMIGAANEANRAVKQ
jgi:hypothetical protein